MARRTVERDDWMPGSGMPPAKLIAGGALALVLLAVAWTSFYTVDPESVGVVTRFGRYVGHLAQPGLHFKWPLGIDRVAPVPVLRQQKQEFGFRTNEPGRNYLDESLMVTGDLNAADVSWSVQYRINDPVAYLFNVRHPEDTLRYAAEAAMREVVGDHTVDEVLTVLRDQVAAGAQTRLQQLMDTYAMGIRIDRVVLQDVTPPEEVRASFNEVNQAQQERERLINEARAQYNQVVPRARGEAQQRIQAAEGYAAERVNQAEGDAARFNAVLTEYLKAPDVTRARLYLETMSQVLPRLGPKYIIDERVPSILPLLQLGGATQEEPTMKPYAGSLILVVAILGAILARASLYTLNETEQAIITQFGKPVGGPVTEAGLHVKLPFVQVVHRLEKRVLEWDGEANEVPTQDKLFIFVDTYARWCIRDPLTFFVNLRDERTARTRIDDILDGETRNVIGQYALIEIVRTQTSGREAAQGSLAEAAQETRTVLPPIQVGRDAIARQIQQRAEPSLALLGIELLDIRFKRINYNADVQRRIYERMISERKQMADKFRSEGQGEAARILGEKERDLKQIESQAYRQVQEIRGRADAAAAEIYARAYNQSPQASEFYRFMKSLEVLQTTLDPRTALFLSTDSELFRFLKTPVPTEGAR